MLMFWLNIYIYGFNIFVIIKKCYWCYFKILLKLNVVFKMLFYLYVIVRMDFCVMEYGIFSYLKCI